LKVVFEGEMTVAGKYIDTADTTGAFGPTICFYPDFESAAGMPHVKNDEVPGQWFCFSNEGFVQSKFGVGKTLDEITVGIKNYTYVRYPSEASSSAELAMVMAD